MIPYLDTRLKDGLHQHFIGAVFLPLYVIREQGGSSNAKRHVGGGNLVSVIDRSAIRTGKGWGPGLCQRLEFGRG